ncbi:MAG: hypothetical protein CM15mP74_17810 [Halieaceae bacterium]|nr:MAG: hypothetical protein CM15mP74_17810 [Halieaceae bacterium]
MDPRPETESSSVRDEWPNMLRARMKLWGHRLWRMPRVRRGAHLASITAPPSACPAFDALELAVGRVKFPKRSKGVSGAYGFFSRCGPELPDAKRAQRPSGWRGRGFASRVRLARVWWGDVSG